MPENKSMHALAEKLFPICRSITGDGVRETLAILREILPEMKLFEVPTGTQAFDWTVPREWRVRDAWVKGPDGRKVIDFKKLNLHVVGYSAPLDCVVPLEELKKYIHADDSAPDAVPYVTSYYSERSGFCMSAHERDALAPGDYHMFIDSELFEGSLTYGEIILPGKTEDEILFSTYVCHPSMANNELSGPCVVTRLCERMREMPSRRFTYRIVFIPETIGSIVYLSRNLDEMRRRVKAGFVVSCVGDERAWSIVSSRYGGTLADRVLENVLRARDSNFKKYSYLQRGSDERQYCSPGVGLPVVGFCRSKYGAYPEYHTSADDLSLISEAGMEGSVDALLDCVKILEHNETWLATCKCEPQLGRRGLYPTTSKRGSAADARRMMNFLAYADGTNDLLGIAEIIGAPAAELVPIAEMLSEHGLIERAAS